MNRSTRLLAAIFFTIPQLSYACSLSSPASTTPAQIIASSTPLPSSTIPPPTATTSPTASPTVPLTNTATPTLTPTVPTPTPTEIPVFWDDFSSEFLPGWSWIRENDALWSLTSEPGYLRIVLQSSRPPRNLLVREVTSENFQIMTHVLFTPTSNFQFAGLLIYQDDDFMATFGRAFCNIRNQCVGNGIYFDVTQSGQLVGNNFGTDTQLKDEAYLRLDKVGSTLTGYYSEDGANWMMIGEQEVFLVDPKVGLMTANSNVAGMVALFDYFTVVEMP